MKKKKTFWRLRSGQYTEWNGKTKQTLLASKGSFFLFNHKSQKNEETKGSKISSGAFLMGTILQFFFFTLQSD